MSIASYVRALATGVSRPTVAAAIVSPDKLMPATILRTAMSVDSPLRHAFSGYKFSIKSADPLVELSFVQAVTFAKNQTAIISIV